MNRTDNCFKGDIRVMLRKVLWFAKVQTWKPDFHGAHIPSSYKNLKQQKLESRGRYGGSTETCPSPVCKRFPRGEYPLSRETGAAVRSNLEITAHP